MPLADGHRDSLAGLTLDDVLANRAAAASSNQLTTTNNCRTLLDIIREDESSKKDRKSWKTFKDKLRLKRAGSAWTSSVLIPASDIPFQLKNYRSLPTQLPRRSSVRVLTFSPVDVTTHRMADPTEEAIKSSNLAATMMTRQRSSRHQIGDAFFVEEKLKPQMSRPSSTRLASLRSDSIRRERLVSFRDSNFDSDDDDEDGDGHTTRGPSEVRQMSAREAVAAQEAAEAAAMAAEAEEEEDAGPFWNKGGGPVTMSLMDLLEETDRQMGLEGSAYRMDDDDDDYDDDDFDEDEDEYEDGEEHNCCVCMVKNICAPFEPCGHSFCRMCSRDLTVSKGNCPLCNNFILEILEVF